MEGSQKVERSKKETATVDASKKKSALFDEEIGDDFLTSWKSASVTNDALDFNCGTPPGRKKGFKFDKLDMDFGFDDGFYKISSFKLDMSDLDFSSPTRKPRMPMGTPGRHSNLGKQEKKSDLFNLDFDFTNKVSFDLGSSLPKGEKKSDNFVEAKAFDFSTGSHQHKNYSGKLTASMDSTENTEAKVEPILDRGSSPKPDFILERKLDAANDDSPSTSVNIGSQIVTQTVTTPEKPVNGSSQENPRESHVAHEYSEHVLLKSNSKQYFEVPVQEISTQLVSSDDSFLGAAQEVQSGDIALERELNTAQGTELGNSHKENIFKRSSPVRSSPPIKNSPRSSSKNCTLEIRENVLSDNPVQGDTEVEVTDVMAVQPMELRALKDIKQIQGSVPKAVSPLNRQMNIGNPVSIKEKTMGTFHSPSLVNFGESEAALNLASIPKNSQPLCDGKINARHSSLPDLKSKKIEESNGKDGNPKTNILKSLKKPAMEGLHVALGNEEKDNGHLTSTSKLSPSNIGRKACDISSLKISRICDLSKFNVQKEKKPMRHRDLGSQMTDSVEKKNFALPSPSLRKKTSEESNAGSVILNPLKRVMESHSGNPNTSSKLWKVSPKSEEAKAVHRDENLHNLKSFSLDQIPSALFIPPDLYMTSLEVPSLIEANGNIEKAEACAKELEDICNMLKKKNEDAKELLARALVNNNLLLMLNHPVYEDKIQKIRKFITNMSKERHF